MKISKKSSLVLEYFDEILPNAKCELNYHYDYELLIAVMLSAQTTDKAVNKVTDILFTKYPTLVDLDKASIQEIEECIKSLGLYKNKAKNIKGICHELIEKYSGKVPQDLEVLQLLPGVGRKTANVVGCELFNMDEFPVDTHINRIAKRLGFAKENDSVLDVELKLRKSFPRDKYIKLHHQFIHFGRYYCSAKKPHCEGCKLIKYCHNK